MRTHCQRHRKALRAGSWLALPLLFIAVAGATEPVGRAAESIDHEARPHGLAAKPRIGRIFFSPAERRSRHDGTATPAKPIGNRIQTPDRLVGNRVLGS